MVSNKNYQCIECGEIFHKNDFDNILVYHCKKCVEHPSISSSEILTPELLEQARNMISGSGVYPHLRDSFVLPSRADCIYATPIQRENISRALEGRLDEMITETRTRILPKNIKVHIAVVATIVAGLIISGLLMMMIWSANVIQ